MRIAIGLSLASEDWAAASAYVVEAERMGVDCVWSAEAWGHDAVSPLAFLAARTSRIRLGTGIMQAGTRTPALIAMTAEGATDGAARCCCATVGTTSSIHAIAPQTTGLMRVLLGIRSG